MLLLWVRPLPSQQALANVFMGSKGSGEAACGSTVGHRLQQWARPYKKTRLEQTYLTTSLFTMII